MSEISLSENNPVSVQLGATTYTRVVSVSGPLFQACGGGPAVTSRTVGGVHVGIGDTDHPKEIITKVLLEADCVPALITANYWNPSGANVALSNYVITDKEAALTGARTRTETYTNSKIQNVQASRTVLGKQTVEITIKSYGISYSSWA